MRHRCIAESYPSQYVSLSLASANCPSVRLVYLAVVFRFSCHQDLRQTDQIVPVVGQKLMRHRVPEQMRVQLYPDQRRILVAQRPHATIR